MATDKSQNMDVNSKQELGWVVPRCSRRARRPSPTGRTRSATPTRSPGSRQRHPVHVVAAPPCTTARPMSPSCRDGSCSTRQVRRVRPGARHHVWWSESGNDSAARRRRPQPRRLPPGAGDVPAGTTVTATFKSLWDIEWDYDYGFVLASTDGGQTYQSLPSAKGYTTPQATTRRERLPRGARQRHHRHERHLRGQHPGSRRLAGSYPERRSWTTSTTSRFVGKSTVLRFSYATDPGFARPGWFIDDLKIRAGDTVIYQTDFESAATDDPRMFSGGCKDQLRTARPAPTASSTSIVDAARRGRSRVLPRDARPLRASTSTARARTTATRSRSSPGCCSSTPTRRTATGTRAATTRRARTRSTRSRSPATRRRT